MIKTTAPVKKITFDLNLSGHLPYSDQRKGSLSGSPLYLANRGIQGKLDLKYEQPDFQIGARDVVKISLHGISVVLNTHEYG
jgi:hypothetical protein